MIDKGTLRRVGAIPYEYCLLAGMSCWLLSVLGYVGPVQAVVPTLPQDWRLQPLAAPSQSLGLMIEAYTLHESSTQIKRWRDNHMQHCQRIDIMAAAAVSQAAHDRHCIGADMIVSLLQRNPYFIWSIARPNQVLATTVHPFIVTMLNNGATLLTSHSNQFEQVLSVSTARSLWALQSDTQQYFRAQGAQLLETQSDGNGFVQTWQLGPVRTHIVAAQSDTGAIILTATEGTAL